MSRKEALSQFIQQIHGRPVVVKLNSGVDYRGKYCLTIVFINIYLIIIIIVIKNNNYFLFLAESIFLD